jgi:hypothetical protein
VVSKSEVCILDDNAWFGDNKQIDECDIQNEKIKYFWLLKWNNVNRWVFFKIFFNIV